MRDRRVHARDSIISAPPENCLKRGSLSPPLPPKIPLHRCKKLARPRAVTLTPPQQRLDPARRLALLELADARTTHAGDLPRPIVRKLVLPAPLPQMLLHQRHHRVTAKHRVQHARLAQLFDPPPLLAQTPAHRIAVARLFHRSLRYALPRVLLFCPSHGVRPAGAQSHPPPAPQASAKIALSLNRPRRTT